MVTKAKTKSKPKTAKSPAAGMTKNTARAGMGGKPAPKPVSRPAGGTKTGGGKPAGGKRSC